MLPNTEMGAASFPVFWESVGFMIFQARCEKCCYRNCRVFSVSPL